MITFFYNIGKNYTVTVNFIHHLDWTKGWPITSETLFRGVSVRVSPEEISTWIKIHPPQWQWASFNLLRAWKEQKGRGRANLLSVWPGTSISSCLYTMAFLVLRPPDSSPGSQDFRFVLWPLWLNWWEYCRNQKVAGLIPGQGIFLGCSFHPQSRCIQSPVQTCTGGNQLMFFSYISVSPFPFLSF